MFNAYLQTQWLRISNIKEVDFDLELESIVSGEMPEDMDN